MSRRLAVRRFRFAIVLGFWTWAVSCGGATDPDTSEIRGTPAEQLLIQSGPDLAELADSGLLVIRVVAWDSSFHRRWVPTTITIETSRGATRDVLLAPNVCLEPKNTASAFPFNFAWMA